MTAINPIPPARGSGLYFWPVPKRTQSYCTREETEALPLPNLCVIFSSTVSNNIFQPILQDTPFPRLFPSPRQERSQDAGYRAKPLGSALFLARACSRSDSSTPDTMGGSSSHCLQREASICWPEKCETCIPPSIQAAAKVLVFLLRTAVRGLTTQLAADLHPRSALGVFNPSKEPCTSDRRVKAPLAKLAEEGAEMEIVSMESQNGLIGRVFKDILLQLPAMGHLPPDQAVQTLSWNIHPSGDSNCSNKGHRVPWHSSQF